MIQNSNFRQQLSTFNLSHSDNDLAKMTNMTISLSSWEFDALIDKYTKPVVTMKTPY